MKVGELKGLKAAGIVVDRVTVAAAEGGAAPDGRLVESAQLALKAGDLKKARNHAIMAERRNPREPGVRAFLQEIEARSAASDKSSALPA
jgi:hypothetical protein